MAAFALFLGVAGCQDRTRPVSIGLGNGFGPVTTFTSPAEFDTVHRGSPFLLGVKVVDEDGVDSVFILPSDTLMASLAFSGTGQDSVFGSYSPFVSNSYVQDTLVVTAFGIDLLGDTGVVVTRHLIVQ